jgi:hypothetical protein
MIRHIQRLMVVFKESSPQFGVRMNYNDVSNVIGITDGKYCIERDYIPAAP